MCPGGLFAHQAEALECARRGDNVVVATPTASGKTLCFNLPVLETVLAVGVVVLFDVGIASIGPLILATLAATVGIAATGTLYGVLASGLRVRETLVPMLLLPVVSPVLLGATRAWEAAIDGVPGDAWPWVGLLSIFAVLYVAVGMLAFGPLLEEA
jgi:heme exporter protein B